MTAPTTRLGDVEPGTYVVLDGKVGRVSRLGPWSPTAPMGWRVTTASGTTHDSPYGNEPVIVLEGDAPREAARWEASDTRVDGLWPILLDDDVYAWFDNQHDAQEHADHLNTSGPDGGPWVPEPLEPERPTPRQAIQSAGALVEEAEGALSALTEHGYAVIDVVVQHLHEVADSLVQVTHVGGVRMDKVQRDSIRRLLKAIQEGGDAA